MLYYKVPIIDGQTDCSAGSILCCAYPQGNYMVCKFESVAKVCSGWVEITADEFETNCPDFPSPLPEEDSGLTEEQIQAIVNRVLEELPNAEEASF